MKSKTSSFNKTIFQKNLTRFAPVWIVYTICLVLGVLLVYNGNGGTVTMKKFYFVSDMNGMMQCLSCVNLGYGLLVAQLLFGDLYNSRMCNALHAMPVKREGWFVTNMLSGLVFSLIPTAVMAVFSLFLLSGSIVADAWQLAWWLFLRTNLDFICFFGLAAFSAMCVGNRFTMIAGYGLLNFGAYIGYWLVDTVYTPLLYGVITPTALVNNLTPMAQMINCRYVKTDSYGTLREVYGNMLEGATTTFQLGGDWWRLFACAGVGILFAVAAMELYRKRKLECAGDAVAFRCLVPVFQVLCAVFVATAGQLVLYAFLGLRETNYLVLVVGLVIGWFVGKMLLERSTRVFRLKNFYGLAGLAAAFALTLVATHFDILGIETRLPDAENVKSVFFESNYTIGTTLTEKEDIEAMIRLQEGALEERAEESGTYVLGTNGEWVRYVDSNASLIDEENEQNRYRYVGEIGLNYELKNGNHIRRRYNVWADTEAGEIAREYLSRWEEVNSGTVDIDGNTVSRLQLVLDAFKGISLSYDGSIPEEYNTLEEAQSLVEAIKADCEAGNMAQHPFFHTGGFRYENERASAGYSQTESIWVSIFSDNYSWSVEIYADSENTLNWLRQRGLLEYEVLTENISLW